MDEWDKAIALYKALVISGDRSPLTTTNLAVVYGAKGEYDLAQAALETYRDNIADIALIHTNLSEIYFYQGKLESALGECEQALSMNPDLLDAMIQKGRIAQCRGDLQTAEEIYLSVLDSQAIGWHLYVRIVLGTLHYLRGQYSQVGDQLIQGLRLAEKLQEKWWQATSHIMLAFMHLKTGDFKKAMQEVDLAYAAGISQESLAWQERALFLKGVILALSNDTARAENQAAELKAFIEKGMNQKKMRDYYQLMGMIESEKGNFTLAITNFEKAEPLLPYEHSFGPFDCDQGLFAEPRALAYLKAGDLEQAIREYERIQSFMTGILYYGDIYVRSYYMLGQVYEQMGDTGKAAENYDRFLDLWKDADPGLPEVRDARERLAGLKQPHSRPAG